MEPIKKTEYQGVKEICERMGWGPNRLQRMITKENFPVGRLGGTHLITTEIAIQEWCNKKVRKTE